MIMNAVYTVAGVVAVSFIFGGVTFFILRAVI